jgi:hypothetical protein
MVIRIRAVLLVEVLSLYLSAISLSTDIYRTGLPYLFAPLSPLGIDNIKIKKFKKIVIIAKIIPQILDRPKSWNRLIIIANLIGNTIIIQKINIMETIAQIYVPIPAIGFPIIDKRISNTSIN